MIDVIRPERIFWGYPPGVPMHLDGILQIGTERTKNVSGIPTYTCYVCQARANPWITIPGVRLQIHAAFFASTVCWVRANPYGRGISLTE